MKRSLTEGNVAKSLLLFAGPMILGNMLQQFYNIADTLIVGRALGEDALAAVGSAYTLMTFLTSVLIGLCMGSGAAFSYYFGRQEKDKQHVDFVCPDWNNVCYFERDSGVLFGRDIAAPADASGIDGHDAGIHGYCVYGAVFRISL